MNKTISIPRALANKLLSLAQGSENAEICGLISQQADKKFHLYNIENIAKEADCAFEMSPSQQISAFKSMRESHEQLFAIYHSHPHSEARPSIKDLQEAPYVDVANIIISLSTQGVLDMRGFIYQKGKAVTLDMTIE